MHAMPRANYAARMGARTQLPLAVTVAPLGDPAAAFVWAASQGIRGVQLSATHPGMRPRDLGASARRDLRATFARLELVASGIDAWIPASHFMEPANAERAIDAACAACELAGELGRVPVTLQLPRAAPDSSDAPRRAEAIAAIVSAADRAGVLVADASNADDVPWPPVGLSLDPAAVLADGGDPAAFASRAGARIASARMVDLLRSGMRGPVGRSGESRLDVLAYRIALEMAGFRGLPVIDARQGVEPHAGVVASAEAWGRAVAT